MAASCGQQSVGELDDTARVGADAPCHRDAGAGRGEARVIRGGDDLTDGLQQLASARARRIHATVRRRAVLMMAGQQRRRRRPVIYAPDTCSASDSSTPGRTTSAPRTPDLNLTLTVNHNRHLTLYNNSNPNS